MLAELGYEREGEGEGEEGWGVAKRKSVIVA